MDANISQPVSEEVETIVGAHLLAEARIAAHFVAVAEKAELSPEEINAHLVAIARLTGLEFWITDEKGFAYLRSTPGVRFRFNPDPAIHPQASAFWPILTGELPSLIQTAQERELDRRVFKYAAVGGVDKPRIVQVGVAV